MTENTSSSEIINCTIENPCTSFEELRSGLTYYYSQYTKDPSQEVFFSIKFLNTENNSKLDWKLALPETQNTFPISLNFDALESTLIIEDTSFDSIFEATVSSISFNNFNLSRSTMNMKRFWIPLTFKLCILSGFKLSISDITSELDISKHGIFLSKNLIIDSYISIDHSAAYMFASFAVNHIENSFIKLLNIPKVDFEHELHESSRIEILNCGEILMTSSKVRNNTKYSLRLIRNFFSASSIFKDSSITASHVFSITGYSNNIINSDLQFNSINSVVLGSMHVSSSQISILHVDSTTMMDFYSTCSNFHIDSGKFKVSYSKFENSNQSIFNFPTTSTTYSQFSVVSSEFRNSTSDYGAIVQSKNDYLNIYISDCLFENNLATLSGGAFYLENVKSLNIEKSRFINNVAKGSNHINKGGGAIAVFTDESTVIISSTEFVGNSGSLGGSIYVNGYNFVFVFNNVYCDNNTAILGSCGFILGEKYSLNVTNLRGNDLLITSVEKILIDVIGYSEHNVDRVRLFPGQQVNLKLHLVDKLDQILPFTPQSLILVKESKSFSIEYSIENNSVSDFFFTQSFASTESEFNVSIQVDLYTTRVFTIEVVNCPFGFTRQEDLNYGFYVCRRLTSPFIIAVSFACFGGLILLLIFGILIIFSISIIGKRLSLLKKKEKAERELLLKFNDLQESFSATKRSETKSYLIPIETLQIVKRIGEGGNGIVYLAKWNNTDVAVKSIKTETEDDDEISIENESLIMSSLRHPNVLGFYGVSYSGDRKLMVVEYAPKGSLEQLIYRLELNKEKMNLKRKIGILSDIVQGMVYLHNLKPNCIVHRDLKPGNILLDDLQRGKICDFGLSKFLGNTLNSNMTTHIGTLYYIAPELFNNVISSDIRKADVYSFSIIMYSLLFEVKPYIYCKKMCYFDGFTTPSSNALTAIPDIIFKQKRPIIPYVNEVEEGEWIKEFMMQSEEVVSLGCVIGIMRESIELMKSCWNNDPNARPNFNRIGKELERIEKLF